MVNYVINQRSALFLIIQLLKQHDLALKQHDLAEMTSLMSTMLYMNPLCDIFGMVTTFFENSAR